MPLRMVDIMSKFRAIFLVCVTICTVIALALVVSMYSHDNSFGIASGPGAGGDTLVASGPGAGGDTLVASGPGAGGDTFVS